jgi:hypothetical protein
MGFGVGLSVVSEKEERDGLAGSGLIGIGTLGNTQM